jgi:hypothetical protein
MGTSDWFLDSDTGQLRDMAVQHQSAAAMSALYSTHAQNVCDLRLQSVHLHPCCNDATTLRDQQRQTAFCAVSETDCVFTDHSLTMETENVTEYFAILVRTVAANCLIGRMLSN